jgi:thymidylate synthase (FAD)
VAESVSDLPVQLRVLDKGFVALTAVMGDDRTAAQCARASFNHGPDQQKTVEEDQRLTRYLVRNRHTGPLEFCQLRYYIKAPMFVVQHLLRHRTASIDQTSMRYVTPEPEFYIPQESRLVSRPADIKQGSGATPVPNTAAVQDELQDMACQAATDYKWLLKEKLAPELARMVLPANLYTQLFYQLDLHNFLHFAGLRTAPDAQWETRQYAGAMLELARPHFPTAISAWEELRNG